MVEIYIYRKIYIEKKREKGRKINEKETMN